MLLLIAFWPIGFRFEGTLLEAAVATLENLAGESEREVARLGPGQLVGELSFLSGEKTSADVLASGEVDARLRQALEPHTREAAVLVVAQRVSTIVSADEILEGLVGEHREFGRGPLERPQ